MNKWIIIGIVALIGVLGIGGVMMLNRSAVPVENVTPQSATPAQNTMEKKSLKSLMGMSGSQQCTFSDTTAGTSGTTYISSGKMRGDFTAKTGETVVTSHMISDGSTVYVWMDGQTTGFKTSVTATENVQESAKQSIDINKEADYSCSGWGMDQSKFSVPTNITFTDYSSMMEDAAKMMKTAPTGIIQQDNAAACSACNSLPTESQAQCKAALKCQ